MYRLYGQNGQSEVWQFMFEPSYQIISPSVYSNWVMETRLSLQETFKETPPVDGVWYTSL